MVFIDVPELLANVKGKAVAMDLDTWGRRGGVTARWPDEVVEAVNWSLAHPQDAGEVRRAMAEDLFYAPGQATDAAVQWILKKLDLPQVAGLPQKVRAQKIQARKVKVPGRASAGTAQ